MFLDQRWDGRTKFAGERFEAEGGVNLYGADIGLDLICSGGHIINAKGDALVLTSARIKGTVALDQRWDDRTKFAGERFEAEGAVNLYGTNIGENLQCIGGSFKVPDGDSSTYAISGDILVVGNCVFLCGRTGEALRKIPPLASFTSDGEVRLVGAQIGMQLNCGGGEFVNKTPNKERNDAAGYALNLELATINQLLLGPLVDLA